MSGTKKSEKAIPATYEPDYEENCDVCGQTPVVTVVAKDRPIVNTRMCGVCTFGTVECLDPSEW